MKKIKQLPTALGLFILLAGLAAGILLIRQNTSQFLRANPESTPKQVKITNITDRGFTVSWITDKPTNGFVKYNSNKELTLVARDDRDEISNQTGEFATHHVTLKGLKPNTTYFFKIVSGKKNFDNNGQNYSVKTGSAIQAPPPENDVAYGTITKADGSPAQGVIVYLSLSNAIPQSTLTKASGSWVIPLNLARATSLTTYAPYDRTASIEEIFVQGGSEGTATAVAVTKDDSPMPTITLGQTFDFRTPQQLITPTPAGNPQPTIPPTRFDVSQPATPTANKPLTITNPNEGESVTANKPSFFGTGPAGKHLTITIHSSQALNGEVVINQDGSWTWTPPVDLSPGQHTVTITLPNGASISRLFTVLAAGEDSLPSFTATASATPTLSFTPTETPTPTPTISLNPTPTSIPTATPAGRVSLPSTESGTPTTGTLTPTILFSIMGIVLISMGLFYNLFCSKNITTHD